MRRMWLTVALATAGLVPLGSGSMAAADEGSTSADQKQEHQIEAQLQKAPDLENNRIVVNVDDGIAVLEGTVDSEQEKKEAQRLAHVDGILGVNNRLKVRGQSK